MPGEFLPPVVTYLRGDISDLVAKVAEARTIIKSLGNESVTVSIKFDINNRSLGTALARAKALTDATDGLTASVARLNAASGGGNSRGTYIYPGGGGGNANNGGGAPGWIGWLAANPNALHAAAIGITALGAAFAGAAVGAGALSAAWASGAGQLVSRANYINQAVSATIPPGVPDYALAKAFGINVSPNGIWAQTQRIGTGQAYGFTGGIINMLNKNNGPASQLLSQEGTNIGSWLDGMVAKMDMASSHGQMFSHFLNTINYDAINVGRTFGSLGTILAKAFAHAPGEIEWITGGLSKMAGGLKDLLTMKVGGVDVGGGILNGFMMYHALGAMSGLLGMGLNLLPGVSMGAFDLHNLGGNVMKLFAGATGAQLGPDAAKLAQLTKANEWMMSAGAAGMSEKQLARMAGAADLSFMGTLPWTAGITALGLLGFSMANYHTPEMGRINAQNARVSAATPLSMMDILGQGISGAGNYIHGLGTFGTAGASIAAAMANGTVGPFAGVHSNLAVTQAMQAGTAIGQWQSAEMSYQQNVIGLARALGVSPGEALLIAQSSGLKMNSKGRFNMGFAAAAQQAKNYRLAYGIFNGKTGETLANMSIGQIVNDSAWKNASAINSNWDAYMGALAGGGQGLGNLFSVLQRVSPTAARNLAMPSGLIPTSQALTSAGQPLLDWFRQAQSVGAISGGQLQKVFLQVAASMGPLAGHSKAAQAELVALANESGLDVKSFGQLMKMTGGAARSQKGLTSSINATTIAMAKFPTGFQNAISAVNNDVSSMADTIIAKNKNAYDAFMNLEKSVGKFGTDSRQTSGAAGQLAKMLEKDGMTATQVTAYFKTLGITWGKIHPQTKNLNFSTNAPSAQREIWHLIQMWAKVPNGQVKTLTQVIATEYQTIYQPGKAPLPVGILMQKPGKTAFGVQNAAAGWSWVGENGPELRYLQGGTDIVANHYVGQKVANMQRQTVVGSHGDVHVYIDGKEMFGNVKVRTQQYNVDNGNRLRGGRPSGVMRPR